MPYVIFLLTVALPCLVWGQHQHTPPTATATVLIPGLGPVNHAVSTSNPEAQRFFDQGLSLIFAFNHDEAVLAFQRAADLDPRLAMAYWGMALALGANYNLPPEPAREKAAYEALQKAQRLASRAPEQERAYIAALSKRYSTDPQADLQKLALEYKEAMGALSQRYPDDLDAATLYAESAMNLRPWQLWNKDGTPAEGTEEIVAVLESVLKRNPDHPGANHYYIHAIEASPNPERALASAARLERLAPASGHLVHMPAHIYMRVGDYEKAAQRNAVAASVDEAYVKSRGVQGTYPLMYYSHNLHFLAIAHAMQGRASDAATAAEKLATHISPHLKAMPMLEYFMPTSILLRVRFRRWDAILQSPPPEEDMVLTKALWQFARGMAFAATGQTEQAEKERQAFLVARQAVPADTTWDLNSANHVLDIAQHVLEARLAMAKSERQAAVELLRKAADLEDSLNYAEPSAWYLPVREMLGGVLLVSGEYGAAESAFRADLANNPRSGRSLFGLLLSLKGQGQPYAAQLVQQELQTVWKNADTHLRLEDL